MEGLRVRKPLVLPVDALGFELRRSIVRWFSIDCGVTVSFIYGVAYLTGMVSFGIPRLICVSFGITKLICASFGITRLICVSFGITRLICASFGITRLICVSFEITRLICASDGITRLIDVPSSGSLTGYILILTLFYLTFQPDCLSVSSGYTTDQFVVVVPLGSPKTSYVPLGSHVARVRERASSGVKVEESWRATEKDPGHAI
ncbi:hypothetical protein E5676_scaffold113G001150 [Cucumis melo var. makuwa]|uniref:Uncharacterized protein n=1 Tax=Cucumis melo var. makuwa TaxID=1194695 RepID=A0A5D3BUU9_CUCMM|nr:hypothetical protein E6C27_scaffold207G001280 [Cucumis melo var. makuwa]TYK01859.1 hypothetical protein E5676_scaffold113G001150 [Cucumis melo var. makuwa]